MTTNLLAAKISHDGSHPAAPHIRFADVALAIASSKVRDRSLSPNAGLLLDPRRLLEPALSRLCVERPWRGGRIGTVRRE
jgi:hypothetical protein